ncbi:I78 family peptidase inhibitor [Parvibaculum sp.]|uniref:I78 family peptidase inhibitor n=1 Tax=Parvibaculum sp. TaxID=2024848 RepID=UPI00271D4FB3|nr:I78 family peptidase inhibitor [Parvibaculum sp.]MDO9127217.1 I78 family peptidase inhibitor [Parvibaculum sp.]MDP1626299.1 I78 family peptidase inhibitor [Parvibaculum sp.]MDP2150604.1 I78 family peptidase inhibitor [Parvibaculum sp.]MDP3328972.1 I78 family peptidase inhibitor [Parvibaculum sp.]
MKYSAKHLLGTVAVAALLAVAACDDSNDKEAAQNTTEEMPAVDNAVPMTSQPGQATPGNTGMADNTAPSSDMPGSQMPDSNLPAGDMSMGEEAAAEGTDPQTIAGTGNAANDCEAATGDDALGVWVGQPYDEAREAIEARQGIETVRVIRPGDAVTQDFREGRLNVELDEEGKIATLRCG